MDKPPELLKRDNNGSGFFKNTSIFGGGSRSPAKSRSRTNTISLTSGEVPSSYQSTNFSPDRSCTELTHKNILPLSSKSPKAPRTRTGSFGAGTFLGGTGSPEKSRPPVSFRSYVGGTSRKFSESSSKSAGDITSATSAEGDTSQTAPSNRDSWSSTPPYGTTMASNPPSYPGLSSATSAAMETATYQHIQEVASKRISTLDYLRKAHEGRVYWFNTLHYNKVELAKLPYFDPRKTARRSTNYLLLGVSLPTILDLNSGSAMEFLRSLNALLAEFESYQQVHPPDGSVGSLSRARIPQMFKRAASSTGGKGRRASSAADMGVPDGGNAQMDNGIATASFPGHDSDLLPGEEYQLLLTPSLPFDPDFYETFATLCDVLIDCYTRLLGLLATPKDCAPPIAEMFTKADARIRKIIVQGVVKEFEESSRAGVKAEVAGVGKMVLGGLM
jgi:hypothetical protein